MTVDIAPISSANYAEARECLTIINRAREVDLPGFPPLPERSFRVGLDHPWPGNLVEQYLVRLDGKPAGRIEISLPQLDNVDNVFADILTDPDLRRHGVGTAMVQFVLDRARELGRLRVAAHSPAPLPGSGLPINPAISALAAHFGFKPVLPEVRRVLDLDTVDNEALDRMLAEAWAKADGYRLVQWSGPAPDELIDDIAYLDGRLVSDAPMGDLTIEAENVDAARIRLAEEAVLARGRRNYDTGLIHNESGRLVCWTLIAAEEGVDWHAWQQITIVDPDHRGHRLGTIAKIENLRYFTAAEPTVRQIGTFNAAANTYMIAINEAMGFRPMHAFENWQLEL